MKTIHKKLSVIGLIIVLMGSFFSIRPLLVSGFFPVHDDTQVVRVHQMAKAIKDGSFPVRWVKDLGYGYGYPIFNFYAPFAYYIGAFITLAGVDVLVSTKIMMGVGFIFAGLSMYYLAREFFGIKAAIVSALLYVYAPYHAVNLYVRGAVSEYWAYGFLPLLFLTLYKILSLLINVNNNSKNSLNSKKNYLFWSILNALSFAGIILSHNLSVLMLVPYLGSCLVICIGILISKKKILEIGFVLYPLILGILLSSFYCLPAIAEMNFTNVSSQLGGNFDYSLHFVTPLQLWESQWGFGGSTGGVVDGMSYRIGKIHLAFSFAAIILLPFVWRNFNKQGKIMFLSVIFFVFSMLLTTPLSQILWDVIPAMRYIQFPWRFLSFVAIFSSLLGGAGVWGVMIVFYKKIPRYLSIISIGIIASGIILFYDELFTPRTIFGHTSYDYINEYNVKWTVSKISDEYMPKGFMKPSNASDMVKSKIVVLKGDPDGLTIERDSTNELVFRTSSNTPLDILIRTAPFPSWSLFINDEKVNYLATNKGLEVKVGPGDNKGLLKFKSTYVQRAANLLSLFGVALLIIGIIQYVSLVQKGFKENL